jgi:hypothetical protein
VGDISRNFSYSEFKVSVSYPQVAAAIEMTQLDKYKCFWLVHLFLQPIRDAINDGIDEEVPITVSSGIRKGELNGLVGGVAHSDHLFNHYSGAVDIIIGDYANRLTAKYLDQIFRLCRRRREYVKQFIYYYSYQEQGQLHGNFIHLSLRDKTTRVWERLWCVSREGRRYFNTSTEAEDYLRNISG